MDNKFTMLETIRAIMDRIRQRTGIVIVTADGEDVDVLRGYRDALDGKPCKRTLPEYVRAYQLAAQRGIGTEKI